MDVIAIFAENNLTPEMIGYKAFNLKDTAKLKGESFCDFVVPAGFVVTTNFFNIIKQKFEPTIKKHISKFFENNDKLIKSDIKEHLSEKYKDIDKISVSELAEHFNIDDFLFLIIKTPAPEALLCLWEDLSKEIDVVLKDLDKELENVVQEVHNLIIREMDCTQIFVRSSSTILPKLSMSKPGGIFKSAPYLRSDLEERQKIKDALIEIYKSIFERIPVPWVVAENGYTRFSMAILFQIFNDSFLGGIVEIKRRENEPNKATIDLRGIRGEGGLLLYKEEWIVMKKLIDENKHIQPGRYRCILDVTNKEKKLDWQCVESGNQSWLMRFDTAQKKMSIISMTETKKIFEQNDLEKLGRVILILYCYFKYPTHQRIEFSVSINRERVYVLQNDYLNDQCS